MLKQTFNPLWDSSSFSINVYRDECDFQSLMGFFDTLQADDER
ncbi:hypothetical protein [Sulfolobus acidocaldarius]